MSRCLRTVLCAVLVLITLPLSAAELDLEFIEGLRKAGYGDSGVDYLRGLEAAKKIPASLAETFNLELARCLQVAAQNTENSDEADKLQIETRTQLDLFLKDHTDHAEAASAFNTYGDLSLAIGGSYMKQVERQKDATRKEPLMIQARTAFEEARPRFLEAETRFKAQFETLAKDLASQEDSPNPKEQKKKKDLQRKLGDAEYDWINARFNLAIVDYHLAQTYLDPKAKEIVPLLSKADKALDSIWLGYTGLLPGVIAHYWTGRVNEQLGQIATDPKVKKAAMDKALAIYDEVTGSEPDSDAKVSLQLLNFYGENYLRRCRLLVELNRRDDMIYDAEFWLKDNIGHKTDSYYGVIIEVAKAYAANAESLPADEKTKVMSKVVRELRDIKKITSSYQNEANVLYLLYAKSGGEEVMIAQTFDEAMAIASAALNNGEAASAVEALERAIELKDQEKDKNRLELVQYQLALAKYQSGDLAGSLAQADKFARADAESKYAPAAAVLGVNASLALYAQSQPADRAAAQKQLTDIINYTIQTWPNRTEADDARIALGRIEMFQGRFPEAIAAFEKLNPASDRYPQAQNLSAQIHRRLYAMARQSGKLDEAGKAHLTQAQTLFQQALDTASKSAKAEDETVAAECRMNLGEMLLEDKEVEKAVAMVAPVESKIRETNPTSLDQTQLRILLVAGRGHVEMKDLAAAQACGQLLLEKGMDIPQVSYVLVNVSRLMLDQYKADQAKLMEISSTAAEGAPELVAAKTAAETSQTAMLDMLTKLLSRQNLRLPELVLIGDTAADMGQLDLAKSTYQRVMDAGEKIPKKSPQEVGALIRVQAALIGLLRANGEYAEALIQVDKLIAAQPKALDPQIERARILQGMAETDSAKWAESTDAWAKLRLNYRSPGKKPPEYYEVIYNLCVSLHGQARNASDQKSADTFKKQAAQLLNGTLALAPDLSGPDMVEKFKALMEELK